MYFQFAMQNTAFRNKFTHLWRHSGQYRTVLHGNRPIRLHEKPYCMAKLEILRNILLSTNVLTLLKLGQYFLFRAKYFPVLTSTSVNIIYYYQLVNKYGFLRILIG